MESMIYLTPEQLRSAAAYNAKELEAGRLTGDQITIAVAAFQQQVGLAVDGKAGPDTRAALDAANAPAAKPVAPGLPQGKGMFIRGLDHTGSATQMIKTMKDNGLTWVCVQRIWQYENGDSDLRNSDHMVEYARAVHAAGFGFWLWGYPVPGKQGEFAQVLLESVDATSAQGIVIDPERPYKNTEGEATALMQALMPGCIDRQVLLGFTSYGAVWYHQNFPWREFSTAHFALPQNYDKDNDLGEDYPTRSHEAYAEHGFRVIIPASAAYSKTDEQMRELLANTPTPQGAIIWWDWYNADENDLWAPVSDFTP
tara:strand:- start:151 stop:1086 length:936 start_codon:yes stop_codon:yes gene_type:complete